MNKGYQIANGKIVEAGKAQAHLWFYVAPTDEEKRYLIDHFKVDEHTLHSALDPDELSRLEFEQDHIAIIFKRPKNYLEEKQLLFRISSAGFFLFQNYLIVVTSEEVPWLSSQKNTKFCSQRDVMLKLMYRTIFHFLDHLKVINMISDELEVKVNESMENRYLINLFSLEKSLVYYLNAINSNSVVLDKLKNFTARIGWTPEEMELLEDIAIENNQCYKQAEIYSNILASLMDARVSIVSNNLNILMKTLNVITICIMVPTFVVSAFSMNVKIPLQEHPLAFWIIMSLAALSMMGFMSFWKHRKW